jgi:hypothetical protein
VAQLPPRTIAVHEAAQLFIGICERRPCGRCRSATGSDHAVDHRMLGRRGNRLSRTGLDGPQTANSDTCIEASGSLDEDDQRKSSPHRHFFTPSLLRFRAFSMNFYYDLILESTLYHTHATRPTRCEHRQQAAIWRFAFPAPFALLRIRGLNGVGH